MKKWAHLTLIPERKCAQTVGKTICPYSMWCSTDPSVIRVSFHYGVIIPFNEKTVKRAESRFLAGFSYIPM